MKEIPLYRVITAKVTFGNINAIDHPVESIKTSSKQMVRDRSYEVNLKNQANKSSSSESSLLSNHDSDETAAAFNSTCVIDEAIFKIPSSYRCINYYAQGSGIDSLLADNEQSRAGAGAVEPRRFNNHHHQPHYGQPIDDDDILLQMAIQQSLASMNDDGSASAAQGGDRPASPRLTALEMLSQQQSDQTRRGRGTQSLSEYHQRFGRLNQYDEDLILQRVLAESLSMSTTDANPNANAAPQQPQLTPLPLPLSSTGDEDALAQVLAMSQREEEERKRREAEEEEELKRIIELSLLEK